MDTRVFEQHQNCSLSIRWKRFKNRNFPVPGLFCQCHDRLLDWLPENVAYELIDIDKMPVEPYKERIKQKKKPKK